VEINYQDIQCEDRVWLTAQVHRQQTHKTHTIH